MLRMNRWELIYAAGMVVIMFTPAMLAVVSGKHWSAAQEKAHERRMAEHRMNARLLRMNI
jgi:hypothetical protein